jgi:hypothetical protein
MRSDVNSTIVVDIKPFMMGQEKSIRISRRPKEKYSVSGSDGGLKYKIGENDFPRRLFEYLDQEAGKV